ncbi:peptidase inhibitor family I36 protein [Streptomyces sp. TBY4]|uniref:peptidase inhibitor family I36 protein n=1 Tax=Streptomyces sp. TBY4 TaxID=2962030 RepID=UPI0020B87F2E|nr:peptidase inhibitor family I36 protein [Streptomyces sp. TBY4]MCP3759526.1 peptidase inhibitor family I36 protein [Streptomyces sp. TBY4]
MKRFLAWAVAGISLVALFLISPIGNSADAVEAAPRPACAPNSFCIYTEPGGKGNSASYTPDDDPKLVYDQWNEQVSTVVNNTKYWTCLYEEFNYSGTIQAIAPGNWADLEKLSTKLDKKVSSHKVAKSKAGCYTGYERCPNGKLCLFSDVAGRGEMLPSTADLGDYKGMDNRVASVANYSTRHVCFFTEKQYSGTLTIDGKTYRKYVVIRSDSTVIPDPWNKNLSSHMLVDTTDDCTLANTLPAN